MTHVLLIDDNIDFCEVYGSILEKEGYEVSAAYDGPSGIEKIDCNYYDILVLDIMMEPIDGWEVLSRVREIQSCSDLSIIILTAKAIFPEDVLQYGDMVQDILMKPVYSAELCDCINRILYEKKRVQEELSAAGDDESKRNKIIYRSKLKTEISVLEKTRDITKERFNMQYANRIPELICRIEALEERVGIIKSEIEALR